ncbi:MAG: phospholipid carrier-dependent glycosyltransferase [Anaerolineales bacterium]|nr:phospholipid carrier-dependent glycosyltransferase [Anaerolineales bacterium]
MARLTLIFCLWLAFLLRVWGLDFGLPYDFHPDEHQYVEAAIDWHTTSTLELSFINPPLYTYLLSGAYWLWLIFSPFETTTDWVSTAYFFARLWSVAFGVLTVALAYPLAKRLGNRSAGLLASALLAVLFLPARESHFAVNDATAAFFVLLAIYFSVVLLDRPQLRTYVLAGLSVGLAASAKLTGGLAVLALLAGHIVVRRRDPQSIDTGGPPNSGRLGAGLLMALVTFLLVFAHIFGDLPHFFDTVIKHLQFGAEGYKGLRMSPTLGWGFYVQVLGWGIGWVTLAAAVIALGLVVWRRHRPGIVVAIFPLALFLYMGAQKILFARFLLPAVPPLIALAAVGLIWLEQSVPVFGPYRRLFWPAIIGVLIAQPLSSLVWFDHLLTLPDTRETATQWFRDKFPEDTVIVKESYALFPTTSLLGGEWPYKIIQIDERGPTRNAVDHYVRNKTQFIALSNFTFDRVRADPVEEAARLAQLDFLEDQAELIQTFNPYKNASQPAWFYLDELYGPAGEVLQRTQPGPLLKIYALPYENQPRSYDVPPVSVPVEANFGDKLLLLGYDLPTRRAQPGEAIPLTLYWQALTRLDQTYVMFTRVLDAQQQRWGGYDRWPQETANTVLWHEGEVVIDTFGVPVAADAPNGVYTIDIGLYDQADPTVSPLPILREGQATGQNSVRLGPLKIGGPPPEVLASADAATPKIPLPIQLGTPATVLLRGYDLDPLDGALKIKLYWESLSQTPIDWSVFVHLRDPSGETVAQKDGPAGGALNYPSSLWDAGEVIIDEIVMPLPDDPALDQYTLVVGLYNLADFSRLTVPDSPNNEIILTTWPPS